MSSNPYMPPQHNFEEVLPLVELPEATAKKIRNCWMAGSVSIAITVIVVVASVSGANISGIGAWALIDVAIMAPLTYGVYRNSRTCAVLLFGVFALKKFLTWSAIGSMADLPLSLVFFLFLGQGIVGTFQRHRLLRDRNSAESRRRHGSPGRANRAILEEGKDADVCFRMRARMPKPLKLALLSVAALSFELYYNWLALAFPPQASQYRHMSSMFGLLFFACLVATVVSSVAALARSCRRGRKSGGLPQRIS